MRANQIGKLFFLSGIFGAVSSSVCAQIGSWRTYYNYRQSYEVARHEGSLYSRNTHSILRYEIESKELMPLTSAQGLHNASISLLSSVEDLLIIGYVDGRVDVLKEGRLSSLTQLQESTLQLPKTVRTVFSSSDKLYVGGDFGLLVFDKRSYRLEDSYFELGNSGRQIAVYEGKYLEDSLFLATDEGLIHASSKKKVDLLDFRNWERPLSGIGKKEQISSWKGKLYSLSPQQDHTLLLRYDAGNWEPTATLSGNYSFLRVSTKGLLIGHTESLLIYDGTSYLQPISLPTDQISQLKDALYMDEVLWVSDLLKGLGRVEEQTVVWLRPQAPEVALPYALQAVENRVYTFYRGLTFPRFRAFLGGFSVFEKGVWQHPTLGQLPVADVVDVLQVEKTSYLSTYENGVWQLVDNKWQPLPSPPVSIAETATRTSALTYIENYLLVATHRSSSQPLLSYRPTEGWQVVNQLASLSGSFVKLVAQPEARQVWGLLQKDISRQMVVFSVSREEIRTISTSFDFSPRQIHDFVVDTRHRLWIATSSGLYLLPQSDLALTPPLLALSPVRLRIQGHVVLDKVAVYALALDGAGRLWCAAETGVWLVEPNSDNISRRFTSKNSPLPPTTIHALAATDEGDLFISTHTGLLSYRSRGSTPRPDYTEVRVFPNPVRKNFGEEVAITNLPAESIVRITTLSGQIVKALQTQGGTATWDTRDQRNQLVSTGVYIIHIVQKDGRSSYVDKIAVLR